MSKIELNNEAWNRRLRFVDDAHNNGVEDQFFKSELDTSHIPTEYVRAWHDAHDRRTGTGKYRWILTHAEDEAERTTEGPADLDESITENEKDFEMYDGDGNLVYRGTVFGDYTGFEPLDDFGTPNWGCTEIRYNGDPL